MKSQCRSGTYIGRLLKQSLARYEAVIGGADETKTRRLNVGSTEVH